MSLKDSDILRQGFGVRAEMQEKWKKKNAEEQEQALERFKSGQTKVNNPALRARMEMWEKTKGRE